MGNQIAVFIDFENIALWAEQEFLDFELTPLVQYLEARGNIAIIRAYGDWSRFSRYREDLMNNAVDLLQVFSVRAGKNRADIRMALDAFELALQRPQLDTFVIVSGDSDFGPLMAKLREYGKHTLGIGPRDVTHPLLVQACDEFVFIETALGELTEDVSALADGVQPDNEAARQLLLKALRVHTQRNELPVLAAKLKQTMLMLDGSFNEANYGFAQFKSWLEKNSDLLTLFVKDYQLYVAPADYMPSADWEMRPWEGSLTINGQVPLPPAGAVGVGVQTADMAAVKPSLRQQYNQIFTRLKMTSVDFATRRDVLRDIYRELVDRPGERTTDELLEELCERYEAQGLIRSKTTLRQIWQMGFRQRAFDYRDQVASVHVPVWLAEEIDSEAAFVQRAESGFVYAVVNAGLDIDKNELAMILLNDQEHVEYIEDLLADLDSRGLVIEVEGRYMLPGQSSIPFRDDPAMQPLIYDIENVGIPDNVTRSFEKARSLAKTAMLQRSQDFAASARSYLMACRLQWDVDGGWRTGRHVGRPALVHGFLRLGQGRRAVADPPRLCQLTPLLPGLLQPCTGGRPVVEPHARSHQPDALLLLGQCLARAWAQRRQPQPERYHAGRNRRARRHARKPGSLPPLVRHDQSPGRSQPGPLAPRCQPDSPQPR